MGIIAVTYRVSPFKFNRTHLAFLETCIGKAVYIARIMSSKKTEDVSPFITERTEAIDVHVGECQARRAVRGHKNTCLINT